MDLEKGITEKKSQKSDIPSLDSKMTI